MQRRRKKPKRVLEAVNHYYLQDTPMFTVESTCLGWTNDSSLWGSTWKVRKFINASSTKEVLFTKRTTTGLNWVARYAKKKSKKEGDEVLISIMETSLQHHSLAASLREDRNKNWSMSVYKKDGLLDMQDLKSKLSEDKNLSPSPMLRTS